jgi:multicomponent Na+:H+ antiporter subunit D
MHVHTTGSIEFGYIGLNGLASLIILIGFGINVGFPLLHAWLTDAYPESTVTGTVFLSAFTTKVAVYALARAFPGTEALVWVGAIMVVFPIFYAVIENNIRRIIAYCIINQGGFMVVGIGIGTALSINGAVAHAFASVLYIALLLMATGAVIHQTGRSSTTDLGGLYKSMPLTAIFCIIGAASISAVPFFSGFVSKSMTVTAAGYEGMAIVWLALLFASATVLIYAGIRVPYFTFFSSDSGIKTEDPPINMLIAMGITAFLCIFIGVVPSLIYNILPYPVDFQPYTAPHIMKQLHLLFFSALAFALFLLFRIYPAEIRAINIDADWFYRKGAVAFMWVLNKPMAWIGAKINRTVFEIVPSSAIWLSKDPVTFLKITSETALLPFMGTKKRAEIKQKIKEERERYPHSLRKHWTIGPTVFWTVFIFFLITLIYFWW